jgi:hypothetical protein
MKVNESNFSLITGGNHSFNSCEIHVETFQILEGGRLVLSLNAYVTLLKLPAFQTSETEDHKLHSGAILSSSDHDQMFLKLGIVVHVDN